MDYAGIELEAQGLGQLQLLLGTMARKLGDLNPLMTLFGVYLESSFRERFTTGVGSDGRRWKPSIRAQLHGGQTLVDSGRLRDSITFDAGSDTVRVGTNVVYAASMHFGRDKPEKVGLHNRLIHEAFGKPLKFGVWQTVNEHLRNPNIPGRPFVGVDVEDVHELKGLTYDFLAPNIDRLAA